MGVPIVLPFVDYHERNFHHGAAGAVYSSITLRLKGVRAHFVDHHKFVKFRGETEANLSSVVRKYLRGVAKIRNVLVDQMSAVWTAV